MADNNQEAGVSVNSAPIAPQEQVPANPYFGSSPATETQTAASPSVVPSPVTTTPTSEKDQAPKGVRKSFSKKKKIILIAAVAALVLVGGGLWFFLAGPASESALEREFREKSPYVYEEAQVDIDPAFKFEFTHNLKPKEGDYFAIHEGEEYMAVYSDAALTTKANADVFIEENPNKIFINPTKYVNAYDSVAGEDVRLSNDGEWGLNDQYYIVQYVDLNNGKKLEKPIVRPFSTKKEIQTPSVSFKTDEQGAPHFSWAPIEGATKYYIVKLKDNYTNNKIIGQTDTNEWVYNKKDKFSERQNADFFDGSYSDDDLLNDRDRINAQEELLKGSDAGYGVVAVTDQERFSAVGLVDASILTAQLPYKEARNLSTKMGLPDPGELTIDTFDQIPTHIPVTMADKSTTLRSVKIDLGKVEKTNKSIIVVGKGYITTVNVPYTIQGTNLTGTFSVTEFNDATYNNDVAKIIERNKAAEGRTGQIAAANIPERPSLDGVKISKTKPTVPYKINATNPLTEYLAANMLNGEEFIDVSDFVKPNSPISPEDAFREATDQNPYILLHVSGSASYLADKKIYVVQYDESRDDMIKEQKVIDDEAKKVIAAIIKPGMNDTQKSQAINDYIVTSATYNYDAFYAVKGSAIDLKKYRNSWTPSGVLIDKTAVCGGYAEAFKVLADVAGLESVYISGLANGNGHAWNKVKINGAWRMIDTTWNDDGSTSNNEYFLLTDDQVSQKRVNNEGKEWMTDALIGNYAAQ